MEPILTKRQIRVLRVLKDLGKKSILDIHQDKRVRKMSQRKLTAILDDFFMLGYVGKDWPKRYWITPRGESKIPVGP